MKIKYVADDGTEFDYADQCVDYENEKRASELPWLILDDNFNKVPVSEFDASSYVYITKSEEVDYLDDNGYVTEGIDIGFKPGWYEYDSDSDVWRNMYDDYCTMKEKIKVYETLRGLT